MKLHRLDLVGFGPYPDRVSIDFDSLAADGLFLLHGDTGAGKTSLLDAVAFALFGAVPGARQDAQRLRCDTTADHTETRVTLELTVAGQRFRISRTPKYDRPKSRGSGRTVSQATASLAWIGTPPPGRAPGGTDRVPEVGLIVSELIGMNADQFFQVVLLPQGEFARFLRAGTDQREQLLERLFDTGRFARVEEWFADARRASAAGLRDAEEVVRRTAAQIAQAAGWRSDVPDRPDEGWLTGVRELVTARSAIADEHLADAVSAQELTADDHRRWLTVLARHRRLLLLQQRRASVALAEPERVRWRQQLDDARRAAPVAAAAAAWQRAGRQLQADIDRRDASITAVTDQPPAADLHLVPPRQKLVKAGAARAAVAALRNQAGELSALLIESGQQDTDLILHDELRTRLDSVVDQRRVLDIEQRTLPAEVDVLTDSVHRLKVGAASLGPSRSAAAAAQAAVQLVQTVPSAQSEVARAIEEAQRSVDVAQAATERRIELTGRRIQNMAAELAGSLHNGDACPVCGSSTHPDAARGDADPVSSEVLAGAEAAEQRAHTARTDAESVRAGAERRLATITAQLAGRDSAELAREARAAAERLAAAQTAAAQLEPAKYRLRELRARQEALTTKLGELAVEGSALQARLTPLAAAIDARSRRLAKAAAGQPTVAHRRQQLLDLADALDAVDQAVHRVRAARRFVEQSWADVASALTAFGSPDLDAALRAAGVDFDTVDAALRAADADAAALAAQLAELESAPDDERLLLLDSEEVERGATTAAAVAGSAQSQATAAFAGRSAAAQRRDDVERLTRTLREWWARLAPQVSADAELSALTDVVLGRGDNRLHISLRAYVLAAWLREVAIAANARLGVLTGGRYSFVHATGKEARGRTGGLGLEVLDQYSGRARPTKTLSGGESFLASLALALGLADVVAAQSSSGLLNTLFIDEGFGSLDAESLDLVMETLDTLRGEGRVIGVVSHVDELRQRIPARLRVRRHVNGSTVEMSVAQ